MLNVRVNQVVLANAVKRVLPVVPSRAVQPILSSFKLTADGETLTITGTDLDHSVVTTVRSIVSASGDAMVNAKEFASVVKAMASKDKNAMVQIQREDSETICLSCNGVTQRLHTTGEAIDYPSLPSCDSPVLMLTKKQMDGITSLNFATDWRPGNGNSVLSGVNLSINGRLDATATDGSRIVSFADSLPVGSHSLVNAIVPNTGIALLTKALDKKAENIVVSGQFSMSGDRTNYLQFVDGGSGEHNTRVTLRMLSGEYPRVAEVWPTDHTATLTYDRVALLAAVKSGAKINKTKVVRLDMGIVSAKNEGTSFSAHVEHHASCELPVFGVNGDFLSDWLESIEDKQVEIKVTGSLLPTERTHIGGGRVTEIPAALKPLVLQESSGYRRYLIMPVQVK